MFLGSLPFSGGISPSLMSSQCLAFDFSSASFIMYFSKYKQQNEGSFVQVRICQYGAKQFMSRLSESAIDNVASLVRLNFKSQALPQFYS